MILSFHDNVFQFQCQNAKMHKNKYKILDKIPVLRFLKREYMINTSDEFREKYLNIKEKHKKQQNRSDEFTRET